MMYIYLASSFNLIPRVREVSKALEDAGFTITCKWWERVYQTKDLGPKETTELKKIYHNLSPEEFYKKPETTASFYADLNGISMSDALVFVADEQPRPFNGANVELGIAIGQVKDRFCYGRLENSPMYVGVHFCNTIDELLYKIKLFCPKAQSSYCTKGEDEK